MKKFLYLNLSLFFLTILLFLTGCKTFQNKEIETKSRVYQEWPQIQFKDLRILLATDDNLACRGFAIAPYEDFEKTIIIFPNISEGTIFVNQDQGFGAVKRDIKIVYLDSQMRVLKEDIMKKEDGVSVAPPGASIAIEGLPAE
jgi:hypothetical protein